MVLAVTYHHTFVAKVIAGFSRFSNELLWLQGFGEVLLNYKYISYHCMFLCQHDIFVKNEKAKFNCDTSLLKGNVTLNMVDCVFLFYLTITQFPVDGGGISARIS